LTSLEVFKIYAQGGPAVCPLLHIPIEGCQCDHYHQCWTISSFQNDHISMKIERDTNIRLTMYLYIWLLIKSLTSPCLLA